MKPFFAVVAVAAIVATAFDVRSADSPQTRTEVVVFMPAIPTGETQQGACWTRSIALDRPGAWRCMAGNSIHDPCFQVPPHHDEVVCGANPALRKTGFVMKLSKPLPAEAPTSLGAAASWWIMQLADGSVCEPFTGTLSQVNGEIARWFCVKPGPGQPTTTLVTKVNQGTTWTVERFAESAADQLPIAGTTATMGNPATASRKVEPQIVTVVKVWE